MFVKYNLKNSNFIILNTIYFIKLFYSRLDRNIFNNIKLERLNIYHIIKPYDYNYNEIFLITNKINSKVIFFTKEGVYKIKQLELDYKINNILK